jgi:peptide/nickel transport system permease protein
VSAPGGAQAGGTAAEGTGAEGAGAGGAPPPEPAGPSRRQRAFRWLRGDLRTMLAVAYLVIVGLVAIFGPLLAPASPNAQDLNSILGGSSAHHWLGTDDLGRDLLSRLIYGARISILASLIAAGVAVVIGIPVGILAGYFGGWLDSILMRVVDTLLSFPAIVLAIGVAAALGPSLVHSMIAVGIVFSPTLARLARGQVLTARERLFVSAAHTYGASSLRVMRRHILPNIVQPMIVQVAFMMGLALLAEAALSFLGLGVQPPTASWGSMLQESFQFIGRAPAQLYPPGLAIALTVLAFNALGDSLRDALDPAVRSQVSRLPGRRIKSGAPDPGLSAASPVPDEVAGNDSLRVGRLADD